MRSVIGFRGYAQRDPLNEYKQEAFILFENLLEKIKRETIKVVFFAKFVSDTDMKSLDKDEAISELKLLKMAQINIHLLLARKLEEIAPVHVVLEKNLNTVVAQFSTIRKKSIIVGMS
ncbi:MAG: hypothetical protein CM15mP98_13200 [Paracoccaceae bacterium]|nr:MAG: hypothetical protein CM15mP98_13200 [Paracoccaceae bacterium]